ncbi:ATP-binding cassette domain-containing protein [Methanococcus maripaludis]|uniref:Molybdate/tungstate import ATP-binding protein WtpC n=1 Tax=Methanococcus maripaludis OS7 TaxID=637915 RepID=A0A2Z5PHV2_METMI|nr:ATP-binding cassette domain-containing protein [Methanococcus maripaludis]BAP63849.1 molybdenum ABC transporter ATP-binding protein [Methanococcus maripaludis OS7]
MSFVKIENLNINLGEFKLEDVNLSVEKGDYVTIIGPTGSGKSILLETALGFYTPETGKIFLEEKDITNLNPEKRDISIIYQDYALFPHMTVYENIEYGLKKRLNDKKTIKEEIIQITKMLGIDHLLNRKPETLSGGEMQRASIARGLIIKPKILFMDEPFSALDVKTKEKIRVLVKTAIKKYGTTVLHVTHDFEDIWSLADKVLIMKGGRVYQYGTPEEVFSNPSSEIVADFVGTNILDSKVEEISGNISVLDVSGVKIYSSDIAKVGENVKVSIRPENIIVALKCFDSSAKNVFNGKVTEIKKRGHLVWLTLDIGGVDLKVLITPNSLEALEIEEDKNLCVMFKATGVKIIR